MSLRSMSPIPLSPAARSSVSVYEVDAKEMQNHAPEDEVRECPAHHVFRQRNHSSSVCPAVPLFVYGGCTYRSGARPWKSSLFSALVCMRREAVRTNWPTVALKPDRKALKG